MLSSTTDESAKKRDKKMETLIVLMGTLIVIWVMASVSLFVHANTQDKTIANYKAYGTRLVLERDTLAKSVEELLQAFNTVTAERDTLRTDRDRLQRILNATKVEMAELHTELESLNTATAECDTLRTMLYASNTERDRLMLAHIAISDNTQNICQYCDAVDSYNFGQCESCGEQDHE